MQSVDGGDEIEQCSISKKAGGSLNVELEPAPSHPLEPRKRVRSDLESVIESEIFEERASEEVMSQLNSVMKVLDSDKKDLIAMKPVL